jgi:hypothetical protein
MLESELCKTESLGFRTIRGQTPAGMLQIDLAFVSLFVSNVLSPWHGSLRRKHGDIFGGSTAAPPHSGGSNGLWRRFPENGNIPARGRRLSVNSTLSQENRERRDHYQSAKARYWWAFLHFPCWFLRPWEREREDSNLKMVNWEVRP